MCGIWDKTGDMTGRALVLGSGGVTGVAWELGGLAGLAQQGTDLSGADLVVGTSAGSVVGAQLTSGVSVGELDAAQLAPPGTEIAARMGLLTMLRYGWVLARSRGPVQARGRLRGPGSVAAGQHQRAALDRRRDALGRQRGPGRGVRSDRGDRAARPRVPYHAQRRQTGGRAPVSRQRGRGGFAGQGGAGRDRA